MVGTALSCLPINESSWIGERTLSGVMRVDVTRNSPFSLRSCPLTMIVNSTKEVIEMNMPGFTAEASLFNVSTCYRATAQAIVYGGLVQPAGDTIPVDRDLLYLLHPYPRWNCLKWWCPPPRVLPDGKLVLGDCRFVPVIC
jgi:hypothetical protein